MYISAWKIHTDGLVIVLRDASSPASLAEDYADYVDSGTIREYIIE